MSTWIWLVPRPSIFSEVRDLFGTAVVRASRWRHGNGLTAKAWKMPNRNSANLELLVSKFSQAQPLPPSTTLRSLSPSPSSLTFLFVSPIIYLVMIISGMVSLIPLACAMNRADTASYKAVPSMFNTAPRGKIKRLILMSTLLFSSRHLIVVGNVAALGRESVQFVILYL